ncbi:MAG: metallophosphoesterase [Porphyromonas sp.]|nr:metallophosphoesterase [Porphyromonas sp.]
MNTSFILPLAVMLLGVAYSTWRVASIFPIAPLGRWLIAGAWLACFILLIVSLVFRDNTPLWMARLSYPLVTSWIIYLLYVVMLFAVLDLLRLVPPLRHYLEPSWTLASLVWIVLVSLFTYASIKYRHKERVPLDLRLSRPLDKPLKIVALSDMHLGYTIGRGELMEWVQLINKERPDLVLIAGDMVDGDTRPVVADNMAEVLNQIEAPIYACLGNHEYIGGEADARAFLRATKVQLLRDSVALYDNRVYIVGRDDRSNPYRKTTAELVAGLDPARPVILLDHQPYHLEESESAGVDLQLSGHTHRGQVWPLNLVVDRMYELSHGYKQRGKTHYYVSSGIGIWGGKYRIGTQSEYAVITIR